MQMEKFAKQALAEGVNHQEEVYLILFLIFQNIFS